MHISFKVDNWMTIPYDPIQQTSLLLCNEAVMNGDAEDGSIDKYSQKIECIITKMQMKKKKK